MKLRHPRTRQEMRAFEAAITSGCKPRQARSLRLLPTAWDDQERARVRSWKQRKCRKQYLRHAR